MDIDEKLRKLPQSESQKGEGEGADLFLELHHDRLMFYVSVDN